MNATVFLHSRLNGFPAETSRMVSGPLFEQMAARESEQFRVSGTAVQLVAFQTDFTFQLSDENLQGAIGQTIELSVSYVVISRLIRGEDCRLQLAAKLISRHWERHRDSPDVRPLSHYERGQEIFKQKIPPRNQPKYNALKTDAPLKPSSGGFCIDCQTRWPKSDPKTVTAQKANTPKASRNPGNAHPAKHIRKSQRRNEKRTAVANVSRPKTIPQSVVKPERKWILQTVACSD